MQTLPFAVSPTHRAPAFRPTFLLTLCLNDIKLLLINISASHTMCSVFFFLLIFHLPFHSIFSSLCQKNHNGIFYILLSIESILQFCVLSSVFWLQNYICFHTIFQVFTFISQTPWYCFVSAHELY